MLAEMAELNDPVLLAPRQTAHNQQISSTSDQHQASGQKKLVDAILPGGLLMGSKSISSARELIPSKCGRGK
jgi:hypothetical protein